MLTRRSFMTRGAALVAAGLTVPNFVLETAHRVAQNGYAAPGAQAAGNRILILIHLAGGADGLSLLVPHGDPAYYAPNLRPSLVIPRPTDTSGSPKVLPIDENVG